MTPRSLLRSLASVVLFSMASAADVPKCPIMTDDDADKEISATYQGKEIHFCCSPCLKQFKKEPDYYVALFQERKSVPAVQDLKVPGDVKLLEQRFCPISTERLIGPASPSVDYKGVKVYLSKPGNVTTWTENPDKFAKEAFEKGLLPQLKGKI